jgi:hypothetical protein
MESPSTPFSSPNPNRDGSPRTGSDSGIQSALEGVCFEEQTGFLQLGDRDNGVLAFHEEYCKGGVWGSYKEGVAVGDSPCDVTG